jgi:O-antigen/teichoic acid export membrane protein
LLRYKLIPLQSSIQEFSNKLAKPVLLRVLSGTVWLTLGSGLGQVAKLIGFMLMARVLGRDEVGHLGSIQNTAFTATSFAVLGLGATTAKLIGQFRTTEKDRAGRIIELANVIAFWGSLILAGLLFAVAAPLAANVFLAPDLKNDLRLGSLLILASSVSTVQFGTLTGLNAFRCLSTLSICQGVLALIFGYIGALMGGQRGALIGLIIASILCCFLANRCIVRESALQRIQIRCKDWMKERKIVMDFAIPNLIAGILAAAAQWIAQTLLVRQDGGAGELALYSVAFQWRIVLLFVPSILARVLVPILSELESPGGPSSAFRTTYVTLMALVSATLMIGIGMIVWSPKILNLYGAAYVGAQRTFSLVVIGAVISSANGLLSASLSSTNRIWTIALANAFSSAGGVLLSMWLVPQFHSIGLAWAFLIAECFYLSIVLSCWLRSNQSCATGSPSLKTA